jgi:hypothetical protein
MAGTLFSKEFGRKGKIGFVQQAQTDNKGEGFDGAEVGCRGTPVF